MEIRKFKHINTTLRDQFTPNRMARGPPNGGEEEGKANSYSQTVV